MKRWLRNKLSATCDSGSTSYNGNPRTEDKKSDSSFDILTFPTYQNSIGTPSAADDDFEYKLAALKERLSSISSSAGRSATPDKEGFERCSSLLRESVELWKLNTWYYGGGSFPGGAPNASKAKEVESFISEVNDGLASLTEVPRALFTRLVPSCIDANELPFRPGWMKDNVPEDFRPARDVPEDSLKAAWKAFWDVHGAVIINPSAVRSLAERVTRVIRDCEKMSKLAHHQKDNELAWELSLFTEGAILYRRWLEHPELGDPDYPEELGHGQNQSADAVI
jgi:hypothetical protein